MACTTTMFERYTERARRVLFFARYEASQLGHLSIETEHLVLGLIREGKGITSLVLARAHVSVEDLRQELEGRLQFKEKVSTSIELPFSAETKRSLAFAAEEADRLLHSHIGTEHLLLGLLREDRSVGAAALMSKGLRLETVREHVVQLLQEGGQVANLAGLTLKLSGYTTDEQQLFRNVLFDQLYSSLPKDPQAKVQIYNAEIAPGGYTNWHCHNGATFFIALQGIFEAEFQDGILVQAKAGDVYSEPIAKFHRGHNPHPDVPYLCIGVCITAPDREHVTNATSRPW
jgi:quercetin dioxygenase-like cupin family protein